jgi:hypothetical protein
MDTGIISVRRIEDRVLVVNSVMDVNSPVEISVLRITGPAVMIAIISDLLRDIAGLDENLRSEVIGLILVHSKVDITVDTTVTSVPHIADRNIAATSDLRENLQAEDLAEISDLHRAVTVTAIGITLGLHRAIVVMDMMNLDLGADLPNEESGTTMVHRTMDHVGDMMITSVHRAEGLLVVIILDRRRAWPAAGQIGTSVRHHVDSANDLARAEVNRDVGERSLATNLDEISGLHHAIRDPARVTSTDDMATTAVRGATTAIHECVGQHLIAVDPNVRALR